MGDSRIHRYSATISALARGQQWERALDLFRTVQANGESPSIVTYSKSAEAVGFARETQGLANDVSDATMTALEKSMQYERALGLFEEMKMRNLPISVVSYGSAIA